MWFKISFAVSVALILATIAVCIFSIAFRKKRRRWLIKPFYAIAIGVFVASSVIFLPIYRRDFNVVQTIILSIHNAIRLFIVDGEFTVISEQTSLFTSDVFRLSYDFVAGILFLAAPMLTLGVVASFFKAAWSYLFYVVCGFKRDAYIFSQLNERSITLAHSLKQNDKRRLIIFTDVFEENKESTYELIERAKNIGALCFKSDITITNFRFHSRKSKLYFFIVGSDDEENINQAIALSSPEGSTNLNVLGQKMNGYDYPSADNRIYIFAKSTSCEPLINAIDTKYMKIRRINDMQSLIYRLLYERGNELFDSAIETGRTVTNPVTGEQENEKLISAVIIGLGIHGTEMLKALPWFGQMYPYRMEINAFDKSPHAAMRFRSECPELYDFDPNNAADSSLVKDHPHNGDFETKGEAHYKITIHSNVDVNLDRFDARIQTLKNATYVLVALGDDNHNIKTAIKIRSLLKRVGANPIIHAIVYNQSKNSLLGRMHNFSNQTYDIIPIGSLDVAYSEDSILPSELEKKALERHLSWIDTRNKSPEQVVEEREREEKSFWAYDYNYRSSIASVIHRKYKDYCKIPGSGKHKSERSEAELWFYRELEHQRWNAYVRSDGYVYAPQRDKLAKTHHLLVPFGDLPYSEQIKDDD